jgi:RNA polymerase sigma-70 factor (ECF subfamily)
VAELQITERDRAVLVRDAEYLVRNHDDAEDVAQDTLIRAWLHRDEFQGRSTSRTYLRSCVRNRSRDFLRHRLIASKPLIDLDAMPEGERERIGAKRERFDEAIDARRQVERTFTFLQKRGHNSTRRRHMQIVFLHASGMSHEEIARELGTTAGTSKAFMFRLRLMLQGGVRG